MTKATKTTPTAANVNALKGVKALAGALEAMWLHMWTRGKNLDTDVTIVTPNAIDIVVSPVENCTREARIRLAFDPFNEGGPWTAEVSVPGVNRFDPEGIDLHARFLTKVAALTKTAVKFANRHC